MTIPALLIAAGLAGAPPAVRDIALPCRPPLETPMAFRLSQYGWTASGTASVITFDRTLRFSADGTGFVLTIGPATPTTNLTGPERERLLTLYNPKLEQPMKLHLDAQGKAQRLDEVDAHWDRYLDRLRMIAELAEANGGKAERTRATIAALRDAAAPMRMAALAGTVDPMVRYCGQHVSGTAVRNDVSMTETLAGEGTQSVVRYVLRLNMGLASRIERVVTPTAQPDKPFREVWTLAPKTDR